MLLWVVANLKARLPVMLRRAGESELVERIEREGWNTAVLADVEQAAREAERESSDDLERAREGMEWRERWKQIHPQFNTVDD